MSHQQQLSAASAQGYPNPMDGLSVFLNQPNTGVAGFGGFASKLSELQAYNPYTSLASMISGLTAANGTAANANGQLNSNLGANSLMANNTVCSDTAANYSDNI